MAKLTGDMIKAGLHVWVIAQEIKEKKVSPLELVIVSGEIEENNRIHVEFAKKYERSLFRNVSICSKDRLKYVIYLGDDGVRPYNYDDRCTQVFTTKESCQECINMLDGRYQNFVCEDGSDKDRIDVECFYDWDD